jgi:phosphoglycolate phosphatase-like HAD superfamily hydrolase
MHDTAHSTTLVLFDIDGTLLRSQGAGIASMQRAFEAMLPGEEVSVAGVPVAGRLDTLIVRDVLAKLGRSINDFDLERFRGLYRAELDRALTPANVRRMPGVAELVARLERDAAIVVGLLTGNWRETARIKIERAGLAPDAFRLGAFAGDGPDRRSLPPVAIERCRTTLGRTVRAERTFIVGDTPLDVDCAVHNGCKVIAVATGDFGVDELAATDADLVVPTLEATDDLVAFLAR